MNQNWGLKRLTHLSTIQEQIAERAVQIVKRAIQAWSPNLNVSFGALLHRALLTERNRAEYIQVARQISCGTTARTESEISSSH